MRAVEATSLMGPVVAALGLDERDVFSVTVSTAGWSAVVVDRDNPGDDPMNRNQKTITGEFEV